MPSFLFPTEFKQGMLKHSKRKLFRYFVFLKWTQEIQIISTEKLSKILKY